MSEQPNSHNLHQSFSSDWSAYYEAMAGLPPRQTLLKALESFQDEEKQRFAVDLGCGEGRDTVELLRRGWRVLAIDSHPEGIQRLLARPDLEKAELLATKVAAFEEVSWPKVDLVNASFCLPFCPPESFPMLWEKIVRSLNSHGRFAGQFFGDRDDWATIPNHTHHTRTQVEELLQSFKIEFFQEEETDRNTVLGMLKRWHIFHIVARKQ